MKSFLFIVLMTFSISSLSASLDAERVAGKVVAGHYLINTGGVVSVQTGYYDTLERYSGTNKTVASACRELGDYYLSTDKDKATTMYKKAVDIDPIDEELKAYLDGLRLIPPYTKENIRAALGK